MEMFDTAKGKKLTLEMSDMAKGRRGNPLILGHPWLIATIKAIQRWDKGQSIMQCQGKKVVVYDLKECKQNDIFKLGLYKKIKRIPNSSHRGRCFAYRVMSFDLTNAPSTFQRFMNYVFQPFFGKSIRVFIDDFCIYSRCLLQCSKIEEGLQRLDRIGGQSNFEKCRIAKRGSLVGTPCFR